MDDRLCVDMARSTYEALWDEGVSDKAVSRGLHRAMRGLRDRWVEEEENAGQGDSQRLRSGRHAALIDRSEARRPLYWVPYVHFGV